MLLTKLKYPAEHKSDCRQNRHEERSDLGTERHAAIRS